MRELTQPVWIYAKAILFLMLGLLAATVLFWSQPEPRTIFLMIVMTWAFCRLYYFMFYVIEHYVDPGYRFSGVLSFLRYVVRRRNS